MKLQSLIEFLTLNNNLHICIHDISGILLQPDLKIDTQFTFHSKPFCTYIKNCQKGKDLCYECKARSVHRAIKDKTPFTGRCYFGIKEIIYPVIINGDVMAIIYLSNMTDDPAKLSLIIDRMANKLSYPVSIASEYSSSFCIVDDFEPYKKMAALICDIIFVLYNKNFKFGGNMHWAVETLKNYVSLQYNNHGISLHNLSKLYYFNEDYIGRLFKKQTGQRFIEYLNNTRMAKAIELLNNTNYNVLEIASMTGFNNVSYFNRTFRQNIGMTPSEYRRKIIK